MPDYEYACFDCGSFTAFRPMAEYQAPHPCPGCGVPAERDLMSVPAFAGMDRATHAAIAANERSANAPRKFTASAGHGPGCGCCTGTKSKKTRVGASGAKSFPAARPWMISH